MLTHALSYARVGWAVFPLREGGKTPATPHGFKDATTDPERITQWWTATPNANVAVATGRLCVIDIDCKHADANGWDSWLALVDANEPDNLEQRTFETATPSGGGHRFYLMPKVPIRNSAGKLGPGLDVRGVGGFVVAPPSRVPAGTYTVEDTSPVQPLPNWLDALLTPTARPAYPDRQQRWERLVRRLENTDTTPRYATAALDNETERVRASANGTRNDTLVRASFSVGTLVGRGDIDAETATAELLAAALAAGLTEREAAQTIGSGLRAGVANPRTVP